MTSDTFLPVVLVTVKTDSASRVEGLKIGADDYVCKPFDEDELLARVEAMLRIKRLHDHVVDARARLEQLSLHDDLTGLYNYRYLHSRLSEEFKRAERYHDPLACLVVDIDRLQAHNDAGGRERAIASFASSPTPSAVRVREVDVVARFGGDEFLVVLPSTHFAGSVTVAERIFQDANQRLDGWEQRSVLPVAVSLGVALFPSRDVRTKDALLRGADAALHAAKRDGGNRICVYQQQGHMYTPVSGASVNEATPSRTRSDRPYRRSDRPTASPPAATPGPAPAIRAASDRDRPPPGRSRSDALRTAEITEFGQVRLEEAPPRVLVVDDEPTLRRTLARMLNSRNMTVLTADDGAQAIEVLGREPVDVVLVDLMMPKVGGLELLDHVRSAHAGVEVIMMTAFGDVETAVKAVARGRLSLPHQALSLERRGRAHGHQGRRATPLGRVARPRSSGGSSRWRSSAS